MKAFNERRRKPSAGLVSSFSWRRSLAEAPASAGQARLTNDRHDEHTPTGILTSDSNLTPAFPALRPVALGACHPLQWRNRPRISRGSLPSDCVSRGPTPAAFKERRLVTLSPARSQAEKRKENPTDSLKPSVGCLIHDGLTRTPRLEAGTARPSGLLNRY